MKTWQEKQEKMVSDASKAYDHFTEDELEEYANGRRCVACQMQPEQCKCSDAEIKAATEEIE